MYEIVHNQGTIQGLQLKDGSDFEETGTFALYRQASLSLLSAISKIKQVRNSGTVTMKFSLLH